MLLSNFYIFAGLITFTAWSQRILDSTFGAISELCEHFATLVIFAVSPQLELENILANSER